MDRSEFLALFREQFEDTDPKDIQFDTRFHDLDEWSSLVGMTILAMATVIYKKPITGLELKNCTTVEQVYNLINNK